MGSSNLIKTYILIAFMLPLLLLFMALPLTAKDDAPIAQNTVQAETEATTPETKPQYTPLEAIVTAYCPCKRCSDEWGRQTASGVLAQSNRTIAVDTTVIPFGTIVKINGKEYVAEDRGGAIKGNRIDIYFDSHEEALKFGKQRLTVYLKNDAVE